MSKLALDRLKSKFGADVLETHSDLGDDTAVVNPERWRAICQFLRTDPQLDFDLMVDLCGVDYPVRVPRIEVVMHLYSTSRRHRLRLKARVGDEDAEGAELDSVVSVWPGVDWFERECFDMFGVTFRGHPDLRRILMYPEFQGHPLRKDYPAQKTQPLIPYRTEEEAGLVIDKQPPFREDEGMPFGRMFWSAPSEDAAADGPARSEAPVRSAEDAGVKEHDGRN